MRLIDADKCFDAIVKWAADEECTPIAEGACKAAEIIASCPTVDAAHVVRCKDCKYRHTFDCMCRDRTYDDWFCADGKPKEVSEC